MEGKERMRGKKEGRGTHKILGRGVGNGGIREPLLRAGEMGELGMRGLEERG